MNMDICNFYQGHFPLEQECKKVCRLYQVS